MCLFERDPREAGRERPARRVRLQVLALGVVGAVLAGCQVIRFDEDVVYACEPGDPCEPPGPGVDTTPPVFRVEAGAGSPPELKRDERTVVRVTSEAPDVDAASVKLEVFWEGERSGGVSLPVTPEPCGEGYCGSVEVDLSVPRMDAFRGKFLLQVRGTDLRGNAGAGGHELLVTREKWTLDTGRTLAAAPVVDALGTVYLHLGERVLWVGPEGTVAGSLTSQGPPRPLLAVGPVTAGGPRLLYLVQVERQRPRLLAVDIQEGRTVASCEASSDFAFAPVLALGTGQASDGRTTDVALAAFGTTGGQTEYLALRPGDARGPCLTLRSGPSGELRLLASGAIFFALTETETQEVSVGASALSVRASKPCGEETVSILVEAFLVGLSTSAMSAFDIRSDDACVFAQVGGTAGLQRPTSDLRAGTGDRFFFGKIGADGKSYLSRVTREGEEVRVTDRPAEGLTLAPVLGRDERLYGLRDEGRRLQVWTSSLNRLWDWEQPLDVRQETNLDCARDARGQPLAARTGVWYVPDGSRLRAIIVDSRGLDTDAPWPRFRHDPPGTGNPATDLAPFRCPPPPQTGAP